MALISQMQNVREFVAKHLSDVIDPSRHLKEDPDRASNGDRGFAIIHTPFNHYRISVYSSYIDPPAGAPMACKSLGTVTFINNATGKQIVGPKADKTWADISEAIHKAELADAAADARRRLAEATEKEVAGARLKLVELADKAKKWGIEIKVPEAPPGDETPVRAEPVFVVSQNEDADLQRDLAAISVFNVREFDAPRDPNAIAPYIGAPVIWVTNPGEAIGGMTEIPAICTKVYSPDYISVFIMPDHSEPSYRDSLPRRGSDAGNGRVHRHNCWDFNPHWLAEQEHRKELHHRLNDIEKMMRLINRDGDNLLDRIVALETTAKEKPRRGRPPKTEGEKPDDAALQAEMDAATTAVTVREFGESDASDIKPDSDQAA